MYNLIYMHLYKGGPDEFILALPKNKYQYFIKLLKTDSSLGIAMDILGLPYKKSDKKIIEIVKDEVFTNADIEEELFYKDTFFKYKFITNQKPEIIISFRKLFNLKNIINSFKIIFTQAKWMANIDQIIKDYENKISDFSQKSKKSFETEIFPYVIALGYLNEYFSQLIVQGKTQTEILQINVLIDSKTSLTEKSLLIVRRLRKLRSEAQKLSFLQDK